MSTTTKLSREQLSEYFRAFTKRFLEEGAPEAVDIEVLEPDLGDQTATRGARLIGITFDGHGNSLEFALETGDHRVHEPTEVWVREDDGFLSAIEVVHPDGTRDVVSLRRVKPEGTG